jgi:hypothetical protein
MASIIADIGDRSAPAADGGGRRAGPSRICIGISSSPPPFPGSPHAAARHASARARHGPRRRDLRAAPESSGVRVRGEVPRLWKLVEPAAAAAGGAVEGGGASEGPVGALRTVSVVFRLQQFGNWRNL